MLNNRFDMAKAQSKLMAYVACDDITGPGFYLRDSTRRTKLNYNVFRGLNTFSRDFVMQRFYPHMVGSILYGPTSAGSYEEVHRALREEYALFEKQTRSVFMIRSAVNGQRQSLRQ